MMVRQRLYRGIPLAGPPGLMSAYNLGEGRADIVLRHAVVAVLFLGMIMGLIFPSTFGVSENVSYGLMSASLALASAGAIPLRANGAWRPPATLYGALLCALTAAGLPGIALHSSSANPMGTSFFVLLAIRNYLCFVGLPRARTVFSSSFHHTIMGWLLASAGLVILGSWRVAATYGVSLDSSVRLPSHGHDWINANAVGVYAAIGVLSAVLCQFLHWSLRLAVGALGAYVLLLTQSRSAVLALAVALVANAAVSWRKNPSRLVVLGLMGGLLFALPHLGLERMRSISQVDAMLRRTEASSGDPWSGRTALIQEAVERLRDAPLFGFGYMSEGSRFENGYLSIALETGLVGFSLYLLFIGMAVHRSLKLLSMDDRPELQRLARYSLCLTAFLLAHAVGEKTHPFQIAFTASNGWAILVGLVFVHTSFQPAAVGVALPVNGAASPDSDAMTMGHR